MTSTAIIGCSSGRISMFLSLHRLSSHSHFPSIRDLLLFTLMWYPLYFSLWIFWLKFSWFTLDIFISSSCIAEKFPRWREMVSLDERLSSEPQIHWCVGTCSIPLVFSLCGWEPRLYLSPHCDFFLSLYGVLLVWVLLLLLPRIAEFRVPLGISGCFK